MNQQHFLEQRLREKVTNLAQSSTLLSNRAQNLGQGEKYLHPRFSACAINSAM